MSVGVCAGVAVLLLGGGGRVSATGAQLPAVNACLNAASSVLLFVGWRFIRRGRTAAHRACMLAAFALSTLFLVGYVVHHARVGSVRFSGAGALRAVYLSILVPHVLFAAALVPLALTTIRRGWTARYDAHKRIARWTLPVWLYVSVSGVAVYVMLYRL